MQSKFGEDIVEKIYNGGIGVIPTDTLYGVVASALNKESVEKLRAIRGRAETKPFIVLIGDITHLRKFGIAPDEKTLAVLKEVWPGPVSVELKVPNKNFEYLTRGTGYFAVRLPVKESLQEFLKKTGPLVAPSVNPPGLVPAKSIEEAKNYFPSLDFYLDDGNLEGQPSTLIGFENDKVKIFRQGLGVIPEKFLN